jgi:hypothetical protein
MKGVSPQENINVLPVVTRRRLADCGGRKSLKPADDDTVDGTDVPGIAWTKIIPLQKIWLRCGSQPALHDATYRIHVVSAFASDVGDSTDNGQLPAPVPDQPTGGHQPAMSADAYGSWRRVS